MTERLPITYAIVGVQKAATSTLHAMLVQHPQVARASRKELHFFDDETRDWETPDYSDYGIDRQDPREKLAGDATPIYLYWPNAMARMRAYDARMRLVASFRDPIERAFSQWMMQVSRGADRVPDFDTLALQGLSVDDPASPPPTWTAGQLRRRAVVARGFYGRQLSAALDLFPREQWLLMDFKDVVVRQDEVQERLAAFLDLEPFPEPAVDQQVRRSEAIPDRPAPSPEVLERLAAALEHDLDDFAALSGLDVSEWPTRQLLTGGLSAARLAEKLHSKARAA